MNDNRRDIKRRLANPFFSILGAGSASARLPLTATLSLVAQPASIKAMAVIYNFIHLP